MENNNMYDVAVIGGGPAGMMAAGRASELGAKVVLLEKNPRLGSKLLITGHGRCNLTNAISSQELAKKLGANGKFLMQALKSFGSDKVMAFFESRGLKLKIENNNRVFPQTDKSTDVLKTLEQYLRDGQVEVRHGAEVLKFVLDGQRLVKITLIGGEEIIAKRFIFATGGKSYPVLGATGDGYKWAKKLGHTITDLHPALSPILVNEPWLKRLEGAPLSNVELTLLSGQKIIGRAMGDGIVTGNGLSGPVAHDLSKLISMAQKLDKGLSLQINFFAGRNMDKELQAIFAKDGKLMLKTVMAKMLAPKVLPLILELVKIDPTLHVSQIGKADRLKLVDLLTRFSLTVKGVIGYDKAIVTAGGVSLDEVDNRTMKSKIIDNLYFAGEVLDLDGPSGGYNLQICWSTGHVAGEAAGSRLDK